MNRAVLYLRLSKEDTNKIRKEDASESILNQRLLLSDYAKANGFCIVDIYSDEDYSGLYNDRPEFDRLIRDSRQDKFDIVIAKTQSRFTRNMEHMERYLHHDFPIMGIRFIGVVDGVDTAVRSNKKARQINGLTNEWYCEDLSENIRSVFLRKMQDGQFLGGFAPYGYLKDEKDKHKFVIDEEAATVVQKIFTLYMQGYSCKAICNKLEDQKVLTPFLYKQKQGLTYQCAQADSYSARYGLWSVSTIKRILSNETYVGKLLQHTHEKVSYKDKKIVTVPKENWIVVEDHHKAIIDRQSFEQVQKLLHQRRIVCSNQDKYKKVYILAGKLRCASCGHTMIKTGGVRGGNPKDRYLRCQLSNKSRNRECTSHSIRLSVVEAMVLDSIQKVIAMVLEDHKNFLEIVDALKDIREDATFLEIKKAELKKAKQKEDNIARTVKLLYTDRAGGQITDSMFYQLTGDLEEEMNKQKMQTDQLKAEIAELSDNSSQEEISDMVQKYLDNFRLTYEIVNDFIDYIEIEEKNKVTKQQKIIIHWNL